MSVVETKIFTGFTNNIQIYTHKETSLDTILALAITHILDAQI